MSHYSRDRLSTVLLASEKPIVRSTKPQLFNHELLARTSREKNQPRAKALAGVGTSTRNERLASQYRWSTSSGEAAAECALPTPRFPVPMSTLERHADPVRQGEKSSYRRREPNIWQQFAREWDMIQARCPMEPRTKPGFTLPKILSSNVAIVNQNYEHNELKSAQANESSDEVATKTNSFTPAGYKPTFTRPMPGYGGFVPRYPAQEAHQCTDYENISSSMCSTTRRTYRGFPREEYHELTFCHKGPLSKTVTLTYPFNPFNKVECEELHVHL